MGKTTREIVLVKKNIRLQEWSRQIEEQKSSGLNVVDWCTQNGVNPKTYYGVRPSRLRNFSVSLRPQWDDGIYSKSKILTNPVKENIFLTLSLTFRSVSLPPFFLVLFRILSRIRRPLDAIYVRSLHSMTIHPPFSMRGAKIFFTLCNSCRIQFFPSRVTRVQSSNCSIVVFHC